MNEPTELKKLVEASLIVVTDTLVDKVKEEERIKEALKKNTKARVTAIDKMQKDIKSAANKSKTSIEQDRWLKLLGCGQVDGKYVFFDGSKIFWLNDNVGYLIKDDFIDVSSHLPRKEEFKDDCKIEESNLKYLIKLKEHYKVTETLYFDIKKVEQCIKIIGPCDIYYLSTRSCLWFVNKETREGCLLIGVKYATIQQ